MGELNRRDLLKGVAAVGSALALPALSSCASSSSSSSTTTSAAADAPTATASALERLPSLVKGEVVFPTDARYDAVRLIWNARFDDLRPQAVVEVADADDVATVVSFVRDNGLDLRVRNGGHSFAGYSISDTVVIDTRHLVELQVSDDASTVTLGAGFTNLHAYEAMWPSTRKAIPGGTCPTVGVAGLTTGGGLGVFGREHGLTSDALSGLELVTADGELVRADATENADLLWAARGGGGGTFGVLTSLTFELIPADMPFTHTSYTYPWSAATTAVAAWQAWLPTSPRRTWSAIFLQTQDPAEGGDPMVELEIVHAGSAEDLAPIEAELLDAIGVAPLDSSSDTTDFLSNESDFYCKAFQPGECELADATTAGKIARPALYGASNVAKSPWPDDGLAVIAEWIERRQADRQLTPTEGFDPQRHVGKLIFEPADGAVNDVPADATAFVHRDALFVMQYQARWLPQSPGEVAEANVDWVSGMYEATAPYRSGAAYQNYIDPRLPDWEQAYFGANLERLRAVKQRVDPDDVFHFAQSIPPG